MKAFLLLAAITFFVRLPFFFPDGFDPDESTFILAAQDIVDGNLPYVNLWPNIPPLALFYGAAVIAVLGKTIPAVRLGGSFCILGAAFLTYLLGKKIRGARAGFIAASFLILFSTISTGGGGVTSEIIAIAPLAGAALLSLKEELKGRDFFFLGLLISCACLVRLNLVYLAVLGGVSLILPGGFLRTRVATFRRALAYIAGGAVPLALVFLPYLVAGKTGVFVTTLFEAPLRYSTSQLNFIQALQTHLTRFADLSYALNNALLAACFLGGLAYMAASWRGMDARERAGAATLLFFLLATGISILKTGPAFEHYLVQAFPFICLVAALFLDSALNTKWKPLAILVGIFSVSLPLSTVLNAYMPVTQRAMAGETLTYGHAYELSDYLKKANPDNAPVYFMAGHIVQWFHNTKPIAQIVTHPHNIGREYLLKVFCGPSATVESELAKILAREPAFIVKPVNVRYLKQHPAAMELLAEKLFLDYELVHVIGDYTVYKHL